MGLVTTTFTATSTATNMTKESRALTEFQLEVAHYGACNGWTGLLEPSVFFKGGEVGSSKLGCAVFPSSDPEGLLYGMSSFLYVSVA